MQRVPNPNLDLFVVRNFLSPELCAAIIERIEEQRRPSTIADDTGVANYRTSETCDLDPADPGAAEVDHKICSLLGLDPSLGDTVLPRATNPGSNGLQSAALQKSFHVGAELAVVVEHDESIRAGKRKGVPQLLNNPLSLEG